MGNFGRACTCTCWNEINGHPFVVFQIRPVGGNTACFWMANKTYQKNRLCLKGLDHIISGLNLRKIHCPQFSPVVSLFLCSYLPIDLYLSIYCFFFSGSLLRSLPLPVFLSPLSFQGIIQAFTKSHENNSSFVLFCLSLGHFHFFSTSCHVCMCVCMYVSTYLSIYLFFSSIKNPVLLAVPKFIELATGH